MRHAPKTTGGGDNQPAFFSPQTVRARRFYLDLSPPARHSVVVVCGGWEHCAPDYQVHRATFPYCSLEFVSRGRGTVRLRGVSHELQPGRVFSYGPDVAHDIVSDPAEPLVKYFVDFAGTRAASLLKSAQLESGVIRQVASPTEVQGLFDELIRNGMKQTPQSGEICRRLLECLLLKIVETRAPLAGPEAFAFSRYQRCREHIEADFQRLRTLGQIARECHINDAYLCRLFKRYDHQSPYQCLLRLKMNLAADLLLKPGSLVKQVAEQVGFPDPFHFSRAFKAIFGLSPEAFRSRR